MACEAERLTTGVAERKPGGSVPSTRVRCKRLRPALDRPSGRLRGRFVRNSVRAAFGPPFLFDSGKGVVRGFSFQKVPNCDWHGPRSHINRVGPIKTADQVPAEIVQIGIEDGGYLRPLFVVAKNLAVANYSDNLAGLRIDNIALEHVFLFCVSDVTFTTSNRRVVPVPVLLSADAARWRAHAVRCPLSNALDWSASRAIGAGATVWGGLSRRTATPS